MPPSVTEEISRISDLSLNGNFLNSLDEITELLNRKEITFEEQLWVKVFTSEYMTGLASLGHDTYSLQDSLDYIQEVIEHLDEIKNPLLMIQAIITNGYTNIYLGNWKEGFDAFNKYKPLLDSLEPSSDRMYLKCIAMNYFYESSLPYFRAYIGEKSSLRDKMKSFRQMKEGEKFCEKNDFLVYRVTLLSNIATIQYYAGNRNASMKTRLKLMEVIKSTGNKMYYSHGLDNLADAYYGLHDYKKFYDLHKERLVIVEELGHRNMLATSYYKIGEYYSVIGSYDEALDYYNKCLEIHQDFNKITKFAFVKQKIGTVYYLTGNLTKALEFYYEALELFEKNKMQNYHFIFADIATVLQLTGELDDALQYLDQLMQIQEGLQDQTGISTALTEQGLIYWQKGLPEKAFELIERGLEIVLKTEDEVKISLNLSYLIQFNLELNNAEKAKQQFESLEQHIKGSKITQVKHNYKFANALILKNSSEERDRIKAEVLFEQLLEEDIPYSLLVKVLLQLCTLLLYDLEESNNPESLEKINKHVITLQNLAEKNSSHILLVETLELKAQLALIEFDSESAKEHLIRAQTIAQENNLDKMVLEILKHQENLTKQSIELKKLEQDKSPISSRMKVVRLEDTVGSIRKSSLTKTVSREEVSKKLLSIQI